MIDIDEIMSSVINHPSNVIERQSKMAPTYKKVTEDIYIECDSFESAVTEVSKFPDSESIVVTKSTIDELTFWTVFTSVNVEETGEMVGAEEAIADQPE